MLYDDWTIPMCWMNGSGEHAGCRDVCQLVHCQLAAQLAVRSANSTVPVAPLTIGVLLLLAIDNSIWFGTNTCVACKVSFLRAHFSWVFQK